jgi:putative aldouronate transport system permease protein
MPQRNPIPPGSVKAGKSPLAHNIGYFKKEYQLYLLILLPLIYFIVFKYIPMSGVILAFRKYAAGDSIYGISWVGFKYFNLFLKDRQFWNIFKNTFVLSSLNFLIGYPIPVIFALLLNELNNVVFKKVVQTVSYLPRFFSTVIVVSMLSVILSPSTGVVNQILGLFGVAPIYFMGESSWFRTIYISSEVWQWMGWDAILYISALANVNPELYEAAGIDGAGRWKQTLHVTLPGIMPTIAVTFILSAGYILSVGFEKVLLMATPGIYDVADVLQTYVYRMGIVQNNYSYATAIGLFQSMISLVLLWGVNSLARRYTENSLW